MTLSYSALKVFTTCEYKYYLQYVLRLREPATPALMFGKNVHDGIERGLRAWKQTMSANPLSRVAAFRQAALLGTRPLQRFTDCIKAVAQYLLAKDFNLRTAAFEDKWGITAQGSPVGFADSKAVIHGVKDLLLPPPTSLIVDWKTGKSAGDVAQLKIYNMAGWYRYFSAFTGVFYYVEQNKETVIEFSREEAEKTLAGVVATAERIERLKADNSFKPEVGPACRMCYWIARCPAHQFNYQVLIGNDKAASITQLANLMSDDMAKAIKPAAPAPVSGPASVPAHSSNAAPASAVSKANNGKATPPAQLPAAPSNKPGVLALMKRAEAFVPPEVAGMFSLTVPYMGWFSKLAKQAPAIMQAIPGIKDSQEYIAFPDMLFMAMPAGWKAVLLDAFQFFAKASNSGLQGVSFDAVDGYKEQWATLLLLLLPGEKTGSYKVLTTVTTFRGPKGKAVRGMLAAITEASRPGWEGDDAWRKRLLSIPPALRVMAAITTELREGEENNYYEGQAACSPVDVPVATAVHKWSEAGAEGLAEAEESFASYREYLTKFAAKSAKDTPPMPSPRDGHKPKGKPQPPAKTEAQLEAEANQLERDINGGGEPAEDNDLPF